MCIMFVSVSVYWRTYGEVRGLFRGFSSFLIPSTLWGIKVKSPGWCSKHLYLMNHLEFQNVAVFLDTVNRTCIWCIPAPGRKRWDWIEIFPFEKKHELSLCKVATEIFQRRCLWCCTFNKENCTFAV